MGELYILYNSEHNNETELYNEILSLKIVPKMVGQFSFLLQVLLVLDILKCEMYYRNTAETRWRCHLF